MAVITNDQDRATWGEPRESENDIFARFGIAQDGTRPSEEALRVQAILREKIADVAIYANAHITDGRNKSIGLTALEDALLRFGKAIFEIPTYR
ncbi:hypothetical protein SEA_FRANSOYER_58 [Microbacterium phage Fransoyer]|nr:hypothetical protein SEA_RUBYRALPH_60 [Microbacterium phage RubyRalph]UUG69623.1 hypothetical protein SEA_FRANSOYER_58 [Microbacterium phage Fransoyer]